MSRDQAVEQDLLLSYTNIYSEPWGRWSTETSGLLIEKFVSTVSSFPIKSFLAVPGIGLRTDKLVWHWQKETLPPPGSA